MIEKWKENKYNFEKKNNNYRMSLIYQHIYPK